MLALASVVKATYKCDSFDQTQLYVGAMNVVTPAEKALMESGRFARVSEGWAVTIVNSTTGEAMGGGTNPMGSYQVYFFNGYEVLGEDFCDAVPSCTESSGKQSCRPRCASGANSSIFSFALGPADAVVYTGCTPPPVEYFGWDMTIAARTTEEYPFYPGQNFGDDFNNRDISADPTDVSIFNQPVSVIQAADLDVIADVKAAYEAAGSPVYTHPIDGSTANLWDRAQGWQVRKPDIFNTIVRLSVPLTKGGVQPGGDFDKYQVLKWPVRFFFAADDVKSTNPFVPSLKSRAVAADGAALPDQTITYADAITALEKSIVAAQAADNYVFKQKMTMMGNSPGFYDDWATILAQKSNASFVLPTRDALYGVPKTSLGAMFQNATVSIWGALQPDAAYHELMISFVDTGLVKSVQTLTLLDADLAGSATRYLQASAYETLASSLFAVNVRLYGQCKGAKYCVEVPEDLSRKTEAVASAMLELGERVYCMKQTSIGPDAALTVLASMALFER